MKEDKKKKLYIKNKLKKKVSKTGRREGKNWERRKTSALKNKERRYKRKKGEKKEMAGRNKVMALNLLTCQHLSKYCHVICGPNGACVFLGALNMKH